ncbi:hypothetical protein MARI151_20007 [Maribacter litoralis]|uniref:Uncharacterized protein n=1 Tax=Maribacter litoralis TaxID=2059726 RepID=A0A653NRK8_9FLAO|nr:hypothetical protein MARI151_20007 [Maribacter litoralis]
MILNCSSIIDRLINSLKLSHLLSNKKINFARVIILHEIYNSSFIVFDYFNCFWARSYQKARKKE